MLTLHVNGNAHEIDADPQMPLVWVLREKLNLTGTKISCSVGLCGACTVMVDNEAVRSCTLPVGDVGGKQITTIEGLSENGTHPVQRAWIEKMVVQCGYCQSGFIMAAAAFLKTNPDPKDDDINASLTNICRCGTYPRIRTAIHLAAKLTKESL